MIAEPFLTSATLAGMAVGLVDGGPTPVTWENGVVSVGTQFGSRAVVTAKCKVWKNAGDRWDVAATSELTIPSAITSGFALGPEKSYALFALNSLKPATLIEWNTADMLQRDKAVTPRFITSLVLEPKIIDQIKLKADEVWSTTDLSPEKWVFSPALSVNSQGPQLWAALHSLRGQGEVWQIDGHGHTVVRATLPVAVDVRAAGVGPVTWVLYRQPTADWNSYYELPGTSLHPPKALPLMLLSLGPQNVEVNLTIKASLGLVYAADFAPLGDRGWLVAASGGPKGSPFLRMVVWNAERNNVAELGFLSLPVPPTQVVVRAVGKEAVCLARHPGPKGEAVCLLRSKLPA